jgi:hypothetical protein
MNVWIIVFVGCFLALSMAFWTTDIWQNKRALAYFSTLSLFSTLAIIISFLITTQQNTSLAKQRIKDEDRKNATDFIAETEKNWIELEKFFNNNYPYLASLYKEIYPNNTTLPTPTLTSDQQIEAEFKQQHACQIMIQIIENIISTRSFVDTSWGWSAIFKSWSKSPIFQKIWSYSKEFYNPLTQEFIDNLISQKLSNPEEIKHFLLTR